jgi:hypothetical protein
MPSVVRTIPKFPCYIPQLTPAQALKAAELAVEINPANRPLAGQYVKGVSLPLTPARLAMVTSKWWGADGVTLPTAFMEDLSNELSRVIFEHLNLWNARGTVNVKFVPSTTDPVIRISRGRGGYYSYLGTDCRGIPRNQQTMNLEAITTKTAASELLRVIPHEAGHALGCPHEHQRPEIVALLDPQKTIAEFRRSQGWSANEVREQVLTPINVRSIMGTPEADQVSVMTYWFPGSITKSGKPIPGGKGINDSDYAFMARMYPVATSPPPVDPPPTADGEGVITIDGKKYKLVATAA